jgi:hypothetical protein
MNKTVTGSALAVVLVILSSPAHAYLDPGTGSMLLQGLIAAAAAGAAVISMSYQRIKFKIRALFGKQEDDRSS